MIALLRRLLGRPMLQQVIADELAEAELSLLQAESAVEFARSAVDYNRSRVARLRARQGLAQTETQQ